LEKKNQHLIRINRQNLSGIENTEVLMTHGVSLLEGLLANKIEIDHSCGGFGTCGTCRIELQESFPAEAQGAMVRNEVETEMALDRGFSEQERLACQTLVICAMKIKIP